MASKSDIVTRLYSLADWRSHRGKLGYDDLVDARGKFVLTVNVMDLAVNELLTDSATSEGKPRQLFILDYDGHWSIYLDAKWLTPRNVQTTLAAFGRLVGKRYNFEPYSLPQPLERRLRADAAKRDRELERERASDQLKELGDFFKEMQKERKKVRSRRAEPKPETRVSPRRFFELSTNKMKF